MTLPLWVRPGVRCVCVDDHWTDTFSIGTAGPFPKADDRFTVAGTHELGGAWYLILAEQYVAPDFYSVSAFRPLTPLENDVAIFDFAFKGAAASTRRELEPAS